MQPYSPYLIPGFVTGIDDETTPWILPKDAFQWFLNGYLHHGVINKRAGMQVLGNMAYDSDPDPGNPIMGIKQFTDEQNVTLLLIWDTKRMAVYNTATQVFDPIGTADIFNGDASNFISSASFGKTGSFSRTTLFFTNFAGDSGSTTITSNPIFYFRTTAAGPQTFTPDTTPTAGTRNYITGCQFIFTMRQRLILLNTLEGTTLPAGTPPTATSTNYPQRMRWCRANNPGDGSGNEWDEITPGNGGFVDAPTGENIISAVQIQEMIIVYFSRSVWVIEPTSDPALPFRWIRVNEFRACDAPYATIGRDSFGVSFGKRGIVGANRVDVKRIDDKIEDFMSSEVNGGFFSRMYSARNFTQWHSWTLYPSATRNLNPATEATTSNYALIHTDDEDSWSFYTVFTKDLDATNGTNLSCLGFGEAPEDFAFEDFTGDLDLAFNEVGKDDRWDSYYNEENTELFLGGDQAGRILYLEKDGDDVGFPIDFELISAGWNPFKEQGIQCQMGYVDFYVEAAQNTSFTVQFYANDITTPYAEQTLDCLPNLGFIADIQDIDLDTTTTVTADQHGLATGDEIFIYNLQGAGELMGGPFTVTVVSKNTITLDGIDSSAYEAYESGGTLVQRRFENQRCWKRAYAGGKGYQHFIRITNSGSDDVLSFYGFMPWFRPAGRMIG